MLGRGDGGATAHGGYTQCPSGGSILRRSDVGSQKIKAEAEACGNIKGVWKSSGAGGSGAGRGSR